MYGIACADLPSDSSCLPACFKDVLLGLLVEFSPLSGPLPTKIIYFGSQNNLLDRFSEIEWKNCLKVLLPNLISSSPIFPAGKDWVGSS
jgi:hypothetical protein